MILEAVGEMGEKWREERPGDRWVNHGTRQEMNVNRERSRRWSEQGQEGW